ncbi:hypothetical protein ACM55F_02490 [Flavobacterium sp. XS2P12]|uniref:hypothetical protein n=1 Tax=Flavobacterium melibiosi TaxID=3398734 RepID=UPI003A8AB643
MAQFRKPFKELFLKEINSYKVIRRSVRIGETLYTIDRLSIDNQLFDSLYEKDLGGEYINDIYCVTCFFEGENIVAI